MRRGRPVLWGPRAGDWIVGGTYDRYRERRLRFMATQGRLLLQVGEAMDRLVALSSRSATEAFGMLAQSLEKMWEVRSEVHGQD